LLSHFNNCDNPALHYCFCKGLAAENRLINDVANTQLKKWSATSRYPMKESFIIEASL